MCESVTLVRLVSRIFHLLSFHIKRIFSGWTFHRGQRCNKNPNSLCICGFPPTVFHGLLIWATTKGRSYDVELPICTLQSSTYASAKWSQKDSFLFFLRNNPQLPGHFSPFGKHCHPKNPWRFSGFQSPITKLGPTCSKKFQQNFGHQSVILNFQYCSDVNFQPAGFNLYRTTVHPKPSLTLDKQFVVAKWKNHLGDNPKCSKMQYNVQNHRLGIMFIYLGGGSPPHSPTNLPSSVGQAQVSSISWTRDAVVGIDLGTNNFSLSLIPIIA